MLFLWVSLRSVFCMLLRCACVTWLSPNSVCIPWNLVPYVNQQGCSLIPVLQTVLLQTFSVGRPRPGPKLCSLACSFIGWRVGVRWREVRYWCVIAWSIKLITIRALLETKAVGQASWCLLLLTRIHWVTVVAMCWLAALDPPSCLNSL